MPREWSGPEGHAAGAGAESGLNGAVRLTEIHRDPAMDHCLPGKKVFNTMPRRGARPDRKTAVREMAIAVPRGRGSPRNGAPSSHPITIPYHAIPAAATPRFVLAHLAHADYVVAIAPLPRERGVWQPSCRTGLPWWPITVLRARISWPTRLLSWPVPATRCWPPSH